MANANLISTRAVILNGDGDEEEDETKIEIWQNLPNRLIVIYRLNNVVIGGTRQLGDFGSDVREKDADDVWDRALRIVPSLQKAEVEKIWSGLRPMRKPVRVETELLNTPTGELKVVHNYGHGGMGVALSWGTAVHAAKLVRHLVEKETASKSKL